MVERLEGTSELFRRIEFSRNQVLGPPFPDCDELQVG